MKKSPSVLFYDNDNGPIEYLSRFNGGIDELEVIKQKIDKYDKAIPKYMLD